MTDTLKSSTKAARALLETIVEGLGRVESSAGNLTRAGADALSSRLPARWNGSRGSTHALGTIVIAGVVASTAALIYWRLRNRDSHGRRRR